MNQLQSGSNLMFKNQHKAPSKKINPISVHNATKKDMKSKSKSKNKSLSKSSQKEKKKGEEQLMFRSKNSHKSHRNASKEQPTHLRKQSSKMGQCNECNQTYSSSHQFEHNTLLRFSNQSRNGSLSKGQKEFSFGCDGKKDRKFSENTHDAITIYEEMKNSHQNEEKLVEKDLNEQEMRRLKKIHTVEEAQCMLKVLHAAKN